MLQNRYKITRLKVSITKYYHLDIHHNTDSDWVGFFDELTPDQIAMNGEELGGTTVDVIKNERID